ncbi:MAG: AAA family ATPase [Ezakiella sp.]|nr:AAA family ATPase [Ezakiella sp.]MDD7471831.1 AAA family ATPase [Bacillota bacterium]MDY3923795.1 AAA family ATPase [Ezakiella sp.]
MQILSINIEEFGGIKNKKIEFKPGINVIYGQNEAGKTTIKNAIDACLYSFIDSGAKRKVYKNEYNTYKSGSYTLSMELIFENEKFVIERNLLHETCRVFDGSNSDITNSIPTTKKIVTPGDYFLGVDANTFRDYFFIDTQSFINDKNLILNYQINNNSDLINKTIDKLKKENEMLGSDQSWQKKRPLLNKKIQELYTEILKIKKTITNYESNISEIENIKSHIFDIDYRLKSFDEEEEITGTHYVRGMLFFMINFILVCVVFVVRRMIKADFSFLYWIIAFVIANSAGLFLYKFKSSISEADKDIDTDEFKNLKNKKIELEKELAYLHGQNYNYNIAKENLLYLEDELNREIAEKRELDKKYELNEMSIAALNYANEYQNKKPKIIFTNMASDFFYQVTGKDELILNDKLDLYLNRNTRLDYSKFSQGTLETAIFSLKLANNELLSQNKPIVLDEAFVFVDDFRLDKIAKILYNISGRKQVLYFTSSKRLLDILKNRDYNVYEVVI